MTVSKPRILFLTADRFPPVRVDTVVLIAKELVGRLEYGVDWVMQSDSGQVVSDYVDWENSRVYVGQTDLSRSFWGRLNKRLLRWRHDLRVIALARKNDYDILQAKDRYFGALVTLVMARICRVPFVFWLSFPSPEASIYLAREGLARYKWSYYLRGFVQKVLLYKVILKYCDLAIVQSEQMKRDVTSEGIIASKLAVMPMGFDAAAFGAILAERAPQVDTTAISYLGTLASERRIDFLVRVLALIVEELPGTKLILVGAGDRDGDEQLLIDEAKRLNVADNMILTGRRPQKEALQMIQATQICLSPFFPTPILNSTSPTKLVEYMALGKPVVANDHPEQKLIIEESRGGFCVQYDETKFAGAIVKLLKSTSLCAEMGARGQRYAHSERRYDVLANRLDKIYTDHIM